MHVCTTQSLRAGLEHIAPTECRICEHKTVYTSCVGVECDTCGADFSHDNLPDLMRQIRQQTGLSRQEIAKELGYKPSTVKKYEWTRTSDVYWVKFRAFILQFYKAC